MSSRADPTSPKSKATNVERWARSSAKGRTRFDLPSETAYVPYNSARPAPASATPVIQPRPERTHRSAPSFDQRPYVSARASYPTFLPLVESTRLQAGWALRGLLDANRWDIVLRLVASDPEVRANVLKSFLLNAISLLSVSVLDFLLHPLAKGRPDSWLHRNLKLFYQILWILPVIGVSFYLNSTWCNLVAKRTYALRYGLSSYVAPPSISTNTYIAFLHSMATSAYRVAMIVTSIALSFALGYIPIVGRPAEFVYFAWVDAFYCFEFIWIARGLSLSQRVRHLEERWAYYFAFGVPVATLCMWGSALANAALFALLFPSYIIMAMHARPGPHDPYNPSNAPTVAHPSPHVPIRIPVFAPVIAIDDAVLRAANFVMRWGERGSTSRPQRTQGGRPERGWGSNGTEEGTGMRDGKKQGGASAGPRIRQDAARKKLE